MTAAGPWSVKGIDPKAREIAKDLARRSGMTLGEWLNQMIIDGGDGDIAPPPFEDLGQTHGQRQAAPRGAAYRPDVREPGRRRLLDEMYREATFAQDAEADLRHEAASRRIPERGYREPAPPEPLRAELGSVDFGRTGPMPARRNDPSELARITGALETLSARLETAEHRSTLAISGIDQSVMGVLSRLDGLDATQGQTAARLEGAMDQVRDTQARVAERVRRMEHEDGSRVDALRALEGALSHLAGQINESAARGDAAATAVRDDVDSLGRRVNKVEASADAATALLVGVGKTRDELDAVGLRVEAVETAIAQAPDAYADAEKVETVLGRLAERLERAEARTTAAVRSLETSFAGLDARLRTNESRARETDVAGEIDRRFQSLAADLSKKVDSSRAELAERLRGAADAGKLGALEATLRDITGQVAQAERRSAQAIDRIGREVVTIAHSLGERVAGVESRSTAAVEHMGGEMTRISDAIDNRLKRADTAQAEAMEKLGGEIARIAERLAERIAASDKRAAETLDAAAGRFARLTDTLSDRQDQTANELTNRIRQSEERTAKLLDDAREKLEQQALDLQRKTTREAALRAVEATAAPPPPPPPAYPIAAPSPALEPAAFHSPGRASDWRVDADANEGADPFATSAAFAPAQTPIQAEVHDDPFGAPGAAFAAPSDAWSPPEAPTVDSAPKDGTRTLGSPPRFEVNPFDPDDDFQAPSSGASIFGPPPMSFEPPAAQQFQQDGMATTPDMEPFGPFSRRDFAADPEADIASSTQPGSTRDMLDQARAAAKRAAAGRDSFKAGAIPAPALDEAEPKAFGISYNGKLKRGGGSTLRTMGLASAWACAITSVAVGAYSLAMKDGGGRNQSQGQGQVADAPTAAPTPAEEDAESKPRLSMALTPPPAATPLVPGSPASAGPISQTAAALASDAKSAGNKLQAQKTPVAAVSGGRAPQTSALANPTLVADKAATPLETARSLYDDSVRKIEAGDTGAVNDLKQAANLGFAPAQFYLGRLYEAGAAGVGKDMVEARRWTQRAAQGGDPAAMYNLASYLYAGDGGAKDAAGAIEWFRKAAERGVVNSQYNLAQLYETGHGVTQNLAEAYKWYLIAAAAGDPEAKANVETLKPRLTADARAAAERTAAALRSQMEGSAHMAAATPAGAAAP